jgi:hypothetical protein
MPVICQDDDHSHKERKSDSYPPNVLISHTHSLEQILPSVGIIIGLVILQPDRYR